MRLISNKVIVVSIVMVEDVKHSYFLLVVVVAFIVDTVTFTVIFLTQASVSFFLALEISFLFICLKWLRSNIAGKICIDLMHSKKTNFSLYIPQFQLKFKAVFEVRTFRMKIDWKKPTQSFK